MNKEVAKIRKKIEERRDDYRKSNDFISSVKSNLCNQLLSFIDSLQEEPVSEELEEVALLYYPIIPRISEPHGVIPADTQSHYLGDANQDKREGFIDGAKWQKQQMMQDAIEREVKVDAGGYPYIDGTELYDYENEKPLATEGDKIKIIIIKE
jgi:hypothetical protein